MEVRNRPAMTPMRRLAAMSKTPWLPLAATVRGGWGCWTGLGTMEASPHLEVLAFVGEVVLGPGAYEDVKGFGVAFAADLGIDLEGVVEGEDATANAELESAVAEVVDHCAFLGVD